MLGIARHLLAVCLVSQCSARLLVTMKGRDYNYPGPNEALVIIMQKALNRLGPEQASHPRLQHLYNLLRQDLHQGPQQDYWQQVVDFNKTLRPKYDVHKLNRVYTTERESTDR